ncbi:hypothetical protein OU995_07745 [Roseateles sp. SL47]|uniref:hypothetical protein n=1 Tax=Roseateles sp. SL47 TaxID=2995138 RepID=UPI00226EC6A1|nr:hypothetical protein [Roseateles sp. SL47]WAC74588.1 hypothetical protein OU995_07745 [Roseateles sp. SL47]
MNPAVVADPLMKTMITTTVLSTASGAASTSTSNIAQVNQGWLNVDLKEADMVAQIPGHITPPPIQRP